MCTKEFKEEAVKMVTEAGLSLPEVGRRLSIGRSTIAYWVKLAKGGALSHDGKRRPVTGEQMQVARLKREVRGANNLDDTKIRDYLRFRPFELPYGKAIKFDAKGLPAPFNFMVQTKDGKSEVIWPKDAANGKLVYPRPAWGE